MAQVLRILSCQTLPLPVAEQEYEMAQAHYLAVCASWCPHDPEAVERYRSAAERQREARERYLEASGR